jgi:hypothetical protein
MAAQECLHMSRILGGHDMNLAKHSEGPKRHIIRVSNGKGDDIEHTLSGLFLTPFSGHRYNFSLKNMDFVLESCEDS